MLRCSGAKRLEISTASSRERTRTMAELRAIDLAGHGGGGQGGELALDFFGDGRGEALGGGQQDGGGVGIVLGLGQHVGGEMARIAIGRR